VISKLYRDLAEHGGRDGRPLSVSTVSHIHRTLRKALADAVQVEQVLAVNPAARLKRPRISSVEPVWIWTVEQLDSFLTAARSHRLFAFYQDTRPNGDLDGYGRPRETGLIQRLPERGAGRARTRTAFVAAGMRTRARTNGTGRTSSARPRLNPERVPMAGRAKSRPAHRLPRPSARQP
jgi:hypothetical protein